MGDGKHPSDVVVAVLAGAGGGFLALFFLNFTMADANFCDDGESRALCIREWASATSGWVAIAAAVVTVYFLIRQTKEAARQTQFLVGDADPVATLEENVAYTTVEDAFAVTLRVINWNRHRIFIQDMRPTDDSNVAIVNTVAKNITGVESIFAQSDIDERRVFVPGWEDRSKAPPTYEFNLTLASNEPVADRTTEEIMESFLVRRHVEIEVDVRVMGPRHHVLTLKAVMPDAMTH